MVDEIRREAATVAFKKSVTRRQENSTKKFQSSRQYVNRIFAWRNRLEVIRVDLEYRTDKEEPSLAQARSDLAHFMENRRHNRLFDDIGGYIWSLEYGGRGRGYHFHVIFFFDGSKVQKDTYIARKIGEYWVDVVTKGRGAYYNCNGNKKRYQRLNRLGIGRIESDDEQKRHNLDHVVQYLTKKDYCLMPEFDGGRVFGKGKSPRINTLGVGRPRKDRSTAENLHLDQPHLSASANANAGSPWRIPPTAVAG
ncbi:inovirus-type Gp2 protein [Rhodoferax sp.]|nr:inovirus-type Gp2 protein [Rhodoferax sp.]MDO9144528.1 inovirus-type Gp2 protein [Rhodoferax sp.]